MRKIIYTVAFAVLLLTSLGAAFAGDTPGGSGSVPDGEHQMWLPVVGNSALDLSQYMWHSECPYPELVEPSFRVGSQGVYFVEPGETYVAIQISKGCEPSFPSDTFIDAFAKIFEVHPPNLPGGGDIVWMTGNESASPGNNFYVRFDSPVVLEPDKYYVFDMYYRAGPVQNPVGYWENNVIVSTHQHVCLSLGIQQ